MSVSNEWIAGFVDGEGCITIGKRYNVAVTIGQIDRRPLEAINQRYPGHIHHARRASARWRDCWTLTVSGRMAVRLLKDILPFLLVKREQAELAIDVMKIKRVDWRRLPLTGWEIAERESYRMALLDVRANA